MTTGAHPNAPAPRANIFLARGCDECRGWGSVVNDGRYEICPACQPLSS
ncbi:hypothetical protein OG883_36285 [Streptomyces sp. NBC_01142]|nr:hypothetical protein [Streptomyces sp. NBC_01142]MCX4825225.1 hypothetical protein [Streptomyces sp. NBC_01142]